MKKNALIIFLIIVIGLLAFLLLRPKSKPETKVIPAPVVETQPKNTAKKPDYQPPTNPLLAKYAKLLPSIQTLLKSEISSEVGSERNISPEKETDITGDGKPELLVDMGYGGAASDMVSIVKIDNNVASVAKIKDSSGKVSNFSFLSGAGGGGRYGSGVEMQSSTNSIKTTEYFVYGEAGDNCEANVFSWNTATKIFEYNKTLSTKATAELVKTCLKIATQMGVKYQGK